MGDSWRHSVQLMKELPDEDNEKLSCIDGARACPPEDCGGPSGYQYFLEAITDPSNEDHDEMVEWIGGTFDPEYFDLEEIDLAVKRVR